MTDFLLAAVAVGSRTHSRRTFERHRMMAAQLLGTGGITSLLLVASATGVRGVDDVALGLALLATFASVAFVVSAAPPEADDPQQAGGG
jgi:multicomponent Na+:H+ antiporter subunit F